MKMKRLAILLCLILILAVSCSKAEEDSKEDSKGGGTSTSSTYPLTGEDASGGSDERIVSVMINNHPDARPQTGLHEADIVFEILAEGSITRFLALYQSELPDFLGPIRSARNYYIDLANDYDSLYVFHGAANFVYDYLDASGTKSINGASYDDDGVVFERVTNRQAPHNSYAYLPAVIQEAKSKGYDMETSINELPFSDGLLESEEAAERIELLYPGREMNETIVYEYDQTNDYYKRYDAGEQTIDFETEEAITMNNVFVIEAPHQVIDEEGRRDIDLKTGGNGYLFRNGFVEEVEWQNKEGMILPFKDGEEVKFSRGNTWINVVPSDPGINRVVNLP